MGQRADSGDRKGSSRVRSGPQSRDTEWSDPRSDSRAQRRASPRPGESRSQARHKLKKLDKVSEDDVKHAEKDLQKVHDEYMAKIEDLLKGKEAEIMEV